MHVNEMEILGRTAEYGARVAIELKYSKAKSFRTTTN